MKVPFRINGVRRLLLIALLLELAMATTMARLLWVQWEENERIVTQKAHEEAVGVANRIAQTLERVDLLMGLMIERMAAAELAPPPRGAHAVPPPNQLDWIARRLPDTSRLLMVDAEGKPRELSGWSGAEPIPASLISLHAGQGTPFAITGSVKSGRPTLMISRRIDRADGRFGGVLAVSLDTDMMSDLGGNPDLTLNSVRLLGEGGEALAQWTRNSLDPAILPTLPPSIGSWAKARLHEVLVAEPVPGFSLRMVATIPRTPFLQQWLSLLLWTGCAFAAVTALAGFGIASVIREVWRRMAAEASLSMANAELERLIEKTRKLASVDALTGIANRRVFNERLEAEVERSRNGLRPLSVIMLDLDHFKLVNDRYGHTFGDQVLVTAAAVLRSVLRESDLPARYGGEEFAVILPNTDLKGACTLAERLCRAFDTPHHRPADASADAGAEEGAGEGLTVTASVGVAQYWCGEDAVGVVARADAALYRSKTDGRNRVSADLEMV
ncbi:sensor domain-containing diguanylate cyclase [Azospirillum isscasi]|uniref:diguanylate cyclase n=1 Tax=Azospirillum isscasi TaxID=3053926 RepID=A0ABU0WGR1_9PROT|nr:diguanylate cyclase [Azospirillum isscasi]MDQ2103392.1 diguanylate cyclase [Azospirillum isscasi]